MSDWRPVRGVEAWSASCVLVLVMLVGELVILVCECERRLTLAEGMRNGVCGRMIVGAGM